MPLPSWGRVWSSLLASAPPIAIHTSLLSTIAALLILGLKGIFLLTCLHPTLRIPHKEDAQVFGILVFSYFRTCPSVFAKTRLVLTPAVDYALLQLLKYGMLVATWMLNPDLNIVIFSTQIFIPVYLVFSAAFVSLLIWIPSNAVKVNIVKCLKGVLEYFVMVGLTWILSIVFILFSNVQHRKHAINHENAMDYVSSCFLLGVGFPILTYGMQLLNRKIYNVWKPPIATTRKEEMESHVSKLNFGTCFDLVWRTVSELIILRTSNENVYYGSTIAAILCRLLVRTLSSHKFKSEHRSKWQVEAEETTPAESIQENDRVRPSTSRTAISKIRSTISRNRSEGTLKSLPKLNESPLKRLETILSSRMILLQTSGGVMDPEALSITSIEEYTSNLVDSKPPQDLPESPFIPLNPGTFYGYIRLGSIISDWSSRCIAFYTLLLLVSMPELASWSVDFGRVGIGNLIIRFFITNAVCVMFEIVSMWMEIVMEFWMSGLTLNSYVFIVLATMSIIGSFFVAETGLMYGNDMYLEGRKNKRGQFFAQSTYI
ncbi:hypothetical protein BC829DRAFT_393224 [Chytridium lagenaria]|nr:hypothetical protein BC829DRAFT_393224 [Chytridium lagenaria]